MLRNESTKDTSKPKITLMNAIGGKNLYDFGLYPCVRSSLVSARSFRKVNNAPANTNSEPKIRNAYTGKRLKDLS
jgi:hypothetical protein